MVGERLGRQVRRDERVDVVLGDTRRAGQREGGGGDGGEFGQVCRRGYLDVHGDQGSGVPGCQMFHWARCAPVCGLIITTLVTSAR